MPAPGLAGLVLGLMAFQAVDRPDPAELVTRLGAPKHADREAAGEALVKMGRAAMPALVKARESRDAELRGRAEILVTRIEAAEVLDATPVRLDIRDRPLAEAVEAIARGSGQSLRPGMFARKPGAGLGWPDARVTLLAETPVPFWQAVDRLCAAGGLQRLYPPGLSPVPFRPSFEMILLLGKARPPASDTGALRVELLRIRHHRGRDYADGSSAFSPSGRPGGNRRDPETGAIDHASYEAELLVSAEPRLRIFGVGDVERAEVVDERGRSLLKVPTAREQEARLEHLRLNPDLDPRLNPGLRYGGSGWRNSTRLWTVTVPLAYQSPRARRIAKFRGVIPVVALARRPDPLVVELKDAAGKAFSAGATRITAHATKSEAGREPTVDFTLSTPPLGEGQTIDVQDARGGRLAVNEPLDLMELRLEVVDARGECQFWQYTRPPTERTQGRMTIVIHGGNRPRGSLDGLRLRYWQLAGVATDLPFVFQDVPTP